VRAALCLAQLATIALLAQAVEGASRRPRFEPTDLDWAEQGTLEIDHQSAITYGAGRLGRRYVASDFELNLGIRSNVEFDIDGGFLRDNSGPVSLWMGDPLWTSVKLGLFDLHTRGAARAIALGVQLGPRLPTLRAGRGIGYAVLGLLGITVDSSIAVLNAGYLLDPGETVSSGRPSAMMLGLDLTQPLGARRQFALLGELGTVQYLSRDPNEYDASLGLAWDPNDHLELSVVVLGGQLASGDRLSLLLGVSPTIELL
jgi:hypothetical protein